MKWINYTKYTPEDLGIDAEDLMKALADYLLSSGFQNPYMQFSEFDEHTLEQLQEAIRRALESGDLFDPERVEQMREMLAAMSPEEIDNLVQRLMQKLVDQGYIAPEAEQGSGGEGENTRFEVTDKSVDFLGFKTLKDLLGSLGRASFGAHDTRDMATGVETSGAAKPYEFGDHLNLDISATLFSAIEREGLKPGPLNLEYNDLHVHQRR